MNQEQYNEIAEFQKKTFPESNSISKLHHLQKEVLELMEAIYDYGKTNPIGEIREEIKMEYADCFILLMGSAQAQGLSYAGLVEAINNKMEINRNRKWGEPDAYGVVNHIK